MLRNSNSQMRNWRNREVQSYLDNWELKPDFLHAN